MKEPDQFRAKFEWWIKSPPFEKRTGRWPMDESKYAWPGQYCDIEVQLAWESWQEGVKCGFDACMETWRHPKISQ